MIYLASRNFIENKVGPVLKRMVREEDGEINMIAIVLIILVVIALAVVFKDGIKKVLEKAFKIMEGEVDKIGK